MSHAFQYEVVKVFVPLMTMSKLVCDLSSFCEVELVGSPNACRRETRCSLRSSSSEGEPMFLRCLVKPNPVSVVILKIHGSATRRPSAAVVDVVPTMF